MSDVIKLSRRFTVMGIAEYDDMTLSDLWALMYDMSYVSAMSYDMVWHGMFHLTMQGSSRALPLILYYNIVLWGNIVFDCFI